MSQEAILNIVLSTVVAITAIFALFQTHRQIKLSNKQFLFNRRLDKYLLAKSLIELYKDNFLIKIEELKKISTEIKFIFKNKESQYLSKFVFNYQNVLMELYKYQILLDNMINDKIPRKQKPSYKELQKEYGELTHRKRLYGAIDSLNSSYKELIKKNAINKIEKSIKL